MKNYEIIHAVYNRNKNQDFYSHIEAYNKRVIAGDYSLVGLEKHAAILDLLRKLKDSNYQITNRDAEILRRYNVLVNAPNTYSSSAEQSFVAISDFHGYTYPLEKVKNHYLKEYDVVFILGDATDRGKDGIGSGGINLLLDIMELSKQYPGKVVYIPGNHDEFLLGYVRSKHRLDSYYSYNYVANLMYNGGEATIKELNRLESENPQKFNELITWLGRQPLQRTHRYKGKDYVLGHAMFNQRLYDINPNYCLEDYFKESQYSEKRRMAKEVLWFRKDTDRYNPSEMPSADKIMVIGHTREIQFRGKNLDVNDSMENPVKVHCVDGGIAYNGGMLKYDGKDSAIWTIVANHNDTSDKVTKKRTIEATEFIYQKHILDEVLKNGKLGIHKAIFGNPPSNISSDECNRIVRNRYGNYAGGDIDYIRSLYVKTFLFDYILKCQLEKIQETNKDLVIAIHTASRLIDMFLKGTEDYNYLLTYGNPKDNYYSFTSKGRARDIAKAIGPIVMEDLLRIYGCDSVNEYMMRKFAEDPKYSKNRAGRH